MSIYLTRMTQSLCHSFMEEFILDPALFADPKAYQPYVYDQTACDAYFAHNQQPDRVYLAIMRDSEPIGELVLKKIDLEKKHCTMGISMKNDSYKNKGYGTKAEMLALEYAFTELGMETVFADALLNNLRSQHVLEKVGFQKLNQDHLFQYYRCDRAAWNKLQSQKTAANSQ